jgi:hypothetical protein
VGGSGFGPPTGYFDIAFCFSRPNRMNALLARSPVTSQVLNVSRHSLACGDFRLNAPLVTSSMKPRSWSSVNARLVLAASALPGRAPGDYLLRCFMNIRMT